MWSLYEQRYENFIALLLIIAGALEETSRMDAEETEGTERLKEPTSKC